MYTLDDELRLKYGKKASELVMPHFVQAVRRQQEITDKIKADCEAKNEKLIDTRTPAGLTVELVSDTYRRLASAGFPCVAMRLLMSGWLAHFVQTAMAAVAENLKEVANKKGPADE